MLSVHGILNSMARKALNYYLWLESLRNGHFKPQFVCWYSIYIPTHKLYKIHIGVLPIIFFSYPIFQYSCDKNAHVIVKFRGNADHISAFGQGKYEYFYYEYLKL